MQGALVDALLRVGDPAAHDLPFLSQWQLQLAALQGCAPAERARREHAVNMCSISATPSHWNMHAKCSGDQGIERCRVSPGCLWAVVVAQSAAGHTATRHR